MNEQIAEEVRVLLARRRLTASELARLTGMTQRSISRRLTGEKVIDVADLERIADALGVSVGELLPKEAHRTTHEYGEPIDPLAPRIVRTIGENTPTLPTTRPVRQTRPTRPTTRRDTPMARPRTPTIR